MVSESRRWGSPRNWDAARVVEESPERNLSSWNMIIPTNLGADQDPDSWLDRRGRDGHGGVHV